MSAADPVAQPYVVRRTYQTAAQGCYGWANRAQSYATLEAAEAAHGAPLGRGELDTELLEWRRDPDSNTGWRLCLLHKRGRRK